MSNDKTSKTQNQPAKKAVSSPHPGDKKSGAPAQQHAKDSKEPNKHQR